MVFSGVANSYKMVAWREIEIYTEIAFLHPAYTQ